MDKFHPGSLKIVRQCNMTINKLICKKLMEQKEKYYTKINQPDKKKKK